MNQLNDEKTAVTLKHIPALDGLRGFAILALALGHFMIAQNWNGKPLFHIISGGWIFVDCFFALSGFLVTSILLDTRRRPDYFRRFYKRRQLRILPLYLFAVLAVFLVSFFIEGRRVELTGYDSLLWYLFYLPNLAITLKGGWLDHSSYLGINHFWAVGVEEQFYLLWPLVVYFIPRRGLMFLAAAILALGTPIRLLTGYIAGDIWGLAPYTSTWCRMDAIAAGAMVAMLLRLDWGKAYAANRRALKPILAACFSFSLLIMFLLAWSIPALLNPAAPAAVKIDFFCYAAYIAGFGYTAYKTYISRNQPDMLPFVLRESCKAIFTVMLIRMIFDLGWGGGQEKFTHSTLCFGSLVYILATTHTQTFLRKFFENRFLVHIGFFSYGIYLFHHLFRPIFGRTIEQWFFIDAALNPFLAQFLYIVTAGLVAYVFARLSWVLIEQPFIRLKK